MQRPFSQIEFQQEGDVFCVRLCQQRLDEKGLEELGAEIARLIDEYGCSRLVLNLGPGDPLCLYSVFLAKLVNLQRRMKDSHGALVLASVSPDTLKIFKAAGLDRFFAFYPDQKAAVAALKA